MLSDRPKEALEWGSRAVELADQLGDHGVKAHALVNIGSVRMQLDPSDLGTLLEAYDLADAMGDRHEAVRALLNIGYMAMVWIQTEVARRYTDMAIAYAERHQVDALLLYTRALSAWLHLRAGIWDDSDRRAALEADTGVAQLLAKTVLAELAVRRGDVDASERLAHLAEQADRTGELQRIVPVLQLETVQALTAGAPVPAARFERVRALVHSPGGWAEATMAAWSAAAGMSVAFQGKAPRPYAAMIEGDWGAAADAFRDAGWTFDCALMLSLLDDQRSLAEALGIARALGAGPLEERTARRMRELGMSIPPRRRSTTLANPAGLTSRQLEVLDLLAEGLTNTQIAERLFVSSRTAEHHVEAIFAKLGVSTRKEAARRSAELGLTSK
jgi:DNA-binding CsgD family transcriptional regulator